MKLRVIAMLVAVVFMVNISGCVSVPEEHKGAATGAGIGAAGGAIAGALLGSKGAKTEMAILGGLAGALVGGLIGHYTVDQKKTAVDTDKKYNYQSGYGTSVRVEGVSATPANAKPGDKVDLTSTYAVLGVPAGSSVDLVEKREIRFEGTMVGNPEARVSRSGGTYTSTVPLFLPSDAKKGMYTVKTTVAMGSSSDSRETTFYVK